MTNTTMRRINKLETAAGVGEEMGIGERLRAARLRWQNDPEGAARDSAASMAAMEARARGEGKPLSKMERRILEARRRVQRDDDSRASGMPTPGTGGTAA